MANIVPIDSITTVPAHLAARSISSNFLSGLPQGGVGYPSIALKGSRFVVKADGGDTVLNTLELPVILLDAKPTIDKTFYIGKFDPTSTEAKSPDCFSKDGVKPDTASTCKQHESCAGCPQNQFGSGTDQNGNPSKGKACKDTKQIAIFVNNTVYGFKVPPSSLKAFSNYLREITRRGVDPSTAITVVGFDPNFSFPVLTFNFGGFLAAEQVAKIDAVKGSSEVAEIVGSPVAIPAPPVIAAPEISLFGEPEAAPAQVVEEPKKPRIVKPKAEAAPTPKADTTHATPAEAELAALLGL